MNTINWSADTTVQENGFSPVFKVGRPPAVISTSFVSLLCVTEEQGQTGNMVYFRHGSDGWKGMFYAESPGGVIRTSGAPGLAVFTIDGNETIVAAHEGPGNDGNVWITTSTNGQTWTNDHPMFLPFHQNNGTSGTPSLVSFPLKGVPTLWCIREGRGNAGHLTCATSTDGKTWSQDQWLTGPWGKQFDTSGAPALVVFENHLYVLRQGSGDNGWMRCAIHDGNSWIWNGNVPNDQNAYGLSKSPAAVAFNGQLHIFHEGRGDSGKTWYASKYGNVWGTDGLFPNGGNPNGTTGAPGVAVGQDGVLYGVHLSQKEDVDNSSKHTNTWAVYFFTGTKA